MRRIRNNPRVRVGPCNARGKPLGPLTEGTARVLPPEEGATAYAALEANWTKPMKAYERTLGRMPAELAYVEVVPATKPLWRTAAMGVRTPGLHRSP